MIYERIFVNLRHIFELKFDLNILRFHNNIEKNSDLSKSI